MKTSIGVAVVGAGMAGCAHAQGYRLAQAVGEGALPDIRLVAIADANPEFAADAARRYGFARAYTDWQQIAEDPEIDAVSVVVPNDLHRQIAVGLLEAGKHVLCEKPLANTIDDGESMVAAAKKQGGVAAIGYTYRRSPAIQAIRDQVAAGNLGDLRQVDIHYWADYGCDPDAPLTWRFRGGAGTGALADIGAHAIDLLEWLGGPITAVSGGRLATFIPERPLPAHALRGHARPSGQTSVAAKAPVENEDAAMFTAGFRSGAIATLSVSRVAPGHPNTLQFSLLGTKGTAAFDQRRPAEFMFFDLTAPEITGGFRQVLTGPSHPYLGRGLPITHAGVGYGSSDLFVFQARAFLEQVAGVQSLPQCASFEDGLRTLRVIRAVVRSAERDGEAVDLP